VPPRIFRCGPWPCQKRRGRHAMLLQGGSGQECYLQINVMRVCQRGVDCATRGDVQQSERHEKLWKASNYVNFLKSPEEEGGCTMLRRWCATGSAAAAPWCPGKGSAFRAFLGRCGEAARSRPSSRRNFAYGSERVPHDLVAARRLKLAAPRCRAQNPVL